MKKVPGKSSMSYINAHRNWEAFRDYYFELYNTFVNKSKFRNKKFK
ncbi:MAG TPA: hypothetical protein PK294_05670 [Ignavibacteria bacterium]|nr:hypothetical protein [Ignavibacteria bacterium]